MSIAAPSAPPTATRTARSARWLVVVRDDDDQEYGGIWSDAELATEARSLTTWLRGLARLEAEILSL